MVKFQGKVLTHKRTVTLLMDRISVFTSVISSWVAHRQNVKIGYFTAKRISDKQTNKQTNSNFIYIDMYKEFPWSHPSLMIVNLLWQFGDSKTQKHAVQVTYFIDTQLMLISFFCRKCLANKFRKY